MGIAKLKKIDKLNHWMNLLNNFLGEHPQIYFTGLFLKCAFFYLLWPSFYITAFKSPTDAFVYGARWY
jgi:hypothetical protein